MRVAIIGSRSVSMDAYGYVLPYIPKNATEIVSGGAKGADQIAEEYAKQAHLPLKVFFPDYSAYRKRAPLQRNLDIVKYSDYVLVLWDGKSRGSANVIRLCLQEFTKVHVLLIREGKLVQTLFGQMDGWLIK